MTKKLRCTNKYDYGNIVIKVGDVIEVTDKGYVFEFIEEDYSIHHMTKEPDSEGVSYKTWFEEVEVNE